MAKPRLASFYRQLIRSITDQFVLLAPTSYFCRLLRTFGDHFVLLPTNLRTFADGTSYLWRPIFVLSPTE